MRKGLLFLFLMMLLVMAGCTDDSQVNTEGEGTDGEKTGDIVIGFNQDISTIDPHGTNDVNAIQVRRFLFERLVDRELDMSYKPGLATEWTQDDENIWTFKLTEGVTFHNGSDFTAEDVKASLDRVVDPSVSAPTKFLFEMIESVEVVNDYEVKITTSYPFAPLPNNLAHAAASIMSKESIDADYQNALDLAESEVTLDEYYSLREAGGDEFQEVSEQIAEYTGEHITNEPDGTNYVQFESRAPGENIVFSRFEDYRGDSVVDNLTFQVIPEAGSMMAELESGGVNLTTPVDMSMMDRINSNDVIELVEEESLRTNYLGINTQKAPFDDVKVRQAIDFAIDREALQQGIYDGMASIPNSMVSSSVFGYNEELPLIEQDIDKAKEALSETDVADGFDATLWVEDTQALIDSAVYIQEQLRELNINVSIEQFEVAAFLDMLGNGGHDMFLLDFTASTVDADYLLSSLTLSTNAGFGGNRAFYENETLDGLLESARSATEDEVRLEEYTKIHNLLREEVPYLPLGHPNMTLAFNTDQLDGVNIDAAGYIRLEDVSFK
ncbi:ABC transporter substrate-binding protein [Corticicoccus populi]|uniref:ABC transporter substrate-binding protein n=1 Tax=Corticicoccus populi TaxID=1812821 RepID=A0ABW5WS44_9STAP